MVCGRLARIVFTLMTEPWKRAYRAVTGRLKAVLDRRYVRLDQLESHLLIVRESQESLSNALSSLGRRLEALEESMSSVQTGLARAEAGSDFVGLENPHELRKKLFAADRLARECATSIERLLQADLLIRRDLDAISEAYVEPIS